MGIETLQAGKPYVIAITGRLDTFSSPQLSSFTKGLYEQGINDIVVDMSECEFVSSAGLREIVITQKRSTQGGSLVFRNVQPEVLNIFEFTGYLRILTIE